MRLERARFVEGAFLGSAAGGDGSRVGEPPPLEQDFLSFFNVLNIAILTEVWQVFESRHEQEVLQAAEVSTTGLPPPYFAGGAEKTIDG
ncbi:MAG: hypothetical protein JJT96_19935 [Opitutales bacterium]|nr:hypothetical protein [Opitutales bacterium]